MKGIILAGGSGTRLMPLTHCVSKQMLAVYDKPLIYYPLSTMMLLGLREILIISTPQDTPVLQQGLGDGAAWGVSLSYAVQPDPGGLAQSFIIGENFIGDDNVCLMLGDNILYWANLRSQLSDCVALQDGAYVLTVSTTEPHRFGIAEYDENGDVVSIVEKPAQPKSDQAVIGLYFYDNEVVRMAKALKPSARGELEISDLNMLYLHKKKLKAKSLSRGAMWMDAGTPNALLQAGNFVSIVQQHQGLLIGSPEEVAYNMGYITRDALVDISETRYRNSDYGRYLKQIAIDGHAH